MTEKTFIVPPDNGGNGSDAAYRLTLTVPRRRYLSYLRERWWVVVTCVALAVLGVVAYETVRPETYVSYAQLYITLAPQLTSGALSEARDDFATQIELLKGSRLRNAAMEHFPPETIASLKGLIEVEVTRPVGTTLLQLKVTSSSADVSQQFLKNLIAEYLAFKQATKVKSVEDFVGNLEDEIKTLEPKLNAMQAELTAFEKTNDLSVREEQAASANASLGALRRELEGYLVDVQIVNMNASNGAGAVGAIAPAAASVTNLVAGGETTPLASTNPAAPTPSSLAMLPSDGLLREAQLSLVLDRQRLDELLNGTNMGPHGSNAAFSSGLTQRVEDDERRVAELKKSQASERRERLEELDKRITLTRAYIATNEAIVREADGLIAKARDLRSELQRQQTFYDSLSVTIRNADLSKTMQTERITPLEEPSPGRPEQRNLPLRIFLAVIGGLAVSMGTVFGWHLLDDRFVSVRDVKDQFGEAVLGIVPQIKVPRKQAAKALLAARDPRPHYAESYRHLRSALLLSSMRETRSQTLLLTGATPGEGKTTVAVNLAHTLARSGLKVALVDMDPHHPVGIHALLGKKPQAGVLDFLRGEAQAPEIVQSTDEPNLVFVGSGTHTDHAEGLFLRPQLADLLAKLREDRDFIILDGAPILGSDNSALLVPHVDAVVLVARPFFTRAQQMRHALEMLYQRQAKTVTIVFNRARADDLAGHYAFNGNGKAAKNGTA